MTKSKKKVNKTKEVSTKKRTTKKVEKVVAQKINEVAPALHTVALLIPNAPKKPSLLKRAGIWVASFVLAVLTTVLKIALLIGASFVLLQTMRFVYRFAQRFAAPETIMGVFLLTSLAFVGSVIIFAVISETVNTFKSVKYHITK